MEVFMLISRSSFDLQFDNCENIKLIEIMYSAFVNFIFHISRLKQKTSASLQVISLSTPAQSACHRLIDPVFSLAVQSQWGCTVTACFLVLC